MPLKAIGLLRHLNRAPRSYVGALIFCFPSRKVFLPGRKQREEVRTGYAKHRIPPERKARADFSYRL